MPHYRGLANAIVRGLTMKEWMLAVFAKAGDPLSGGRNIPGGCYSYRRLKIAPVSQVVASWIPKAAGIAYASRLRGEASVTLCTFGDGATSQGEFHEGVNFAAVHRLPVVFVCENNSYAISVPIRLQMANPNVADRAAGYGIPGVTVDGAGGGRSGTRRRRADVDRREDLAHQRAYLRGQPAQVPDQGRAGRGVSSRPDSAIQELAPRAALDHAGKGGSGPGGLRPGGVGRRRLGRTAT